MTATLTLTRALLWRLVHEGGRHLAAPLVPYVIVLLVTVVVSSVDGGSLINGAGSATTVADRYADGGHALTTGLLLTVGPTVAALFNALSVTRAVQGLVGAEVNRGGFEELLGAPYTHRHIAAAVLGYLLAAATAFWAAYLTLLTLLVYGYAAATSGHLNLDGGYVALSLVLPLLVAWATGSLALLVSLLFPRLTQLGSAAGLSGGSVGNIVAMLPALGAVVAVSSGLAHFGAVRLLLVCGGVTLAVATVSVTTVALRFDPESILDS
ncbi:hypothetical protein ABZ307_06005 [Streptomyces griseorubiginosus]|uniref:hypothetical protein n=1 Tax=Streptomyces griseorubiginosus TaxID=67304 RepID=UPI0033A8607C